MPSSLSHAMVALAGGALVAPRDRVRAFLITGMVCAVLPDIDAIGRLLPVDDGDIEFLGGHRGLTHSLTFAASTAAAITGLTLFSRSWHGHRLRLMLFIVFATAAHGALDALTSIGATTSPVQFFSPFSTEGFTSPWHPIHGPFGELFLCVLPSFLVIRYVWHARRLPSPRRAMEQPLSILGTRGAGEEDRRDHSQVMRRWICFGLLALLAFWGWRSEMRLAEARESRSGLQGIEAPTLGKP